MPRLLILGFSWALSSVLYETISHYQCQLPCQPPKSLNKYYDMLEIWLNPSDFPSMELANL